MNNYWRCIGDTLISSCIKGIVLQCIYYITLNDLFSVRTVIFYTSNLFSLKSRNVVSNDFNKEQKF